VQPVTLPGVLSIRGLAKSYAGPRSRTVLTGIDLDLAPGEYVAKLDLEMLGVWAVKLRLAGPVRDQLVLHYEFDSSGATPAKR